MAAVRWQQVREGDTITVEEIHRVIVHKFSIGDVEDPDLFAAQPIWEWQESEPGKFVMEHAIDKPEWRRQVDHSTYGHQYTIIAELEAKKLSEFYLRWGKDGSSKIRWDLYR